MASSTSLSHPLLALAALILTSAIGACAPVSLLRVPLHSFGDSPLPPFAANADLESPLAFWETQEAPRLRELFQREVYGMFPDRSEALIVTREIIDAEALNGAGMFEVLEVVVSATFQGEGADTAHFVIDLFLPSAADGPVGVVLMQTFCPRVETSLHPVVSGGGPGVSCTGGLGNWLMGGLGRSIARAPLEDFLARGYAVASVHSRDVVPDDPQRGPDVLDTLAPTYVGDEVRWGALAAWAWLYSRTVDVLAADERIDQGRIIAFGHSRFGKAALIAAAFDPRISGVISNQSGLGGAALSRDKTGETIAQITETYPHWFARTFTRYADREQDLPVDQHQLLALIAPRPIWLGNARRDSWSDPNGTYRAAAAASSIYQLYGAGGLDQSGMDDFNPDATISYWLRHGFHGVEPSDWGAILRFVDAHFGAPISASSPKLDSLGESEEQETTH